MKLICGYCGEEILESEPYFLHPNGNDLLHGKCQKNVCGNSILSIFGKSLQEIRGALEIVALFSEMLDNGEILKHSIPELGIEYMYFLGEDEICEGGSLLDVLRKAKTAKWGLDK